MMQEFHLCFNAQEKWDSVEDLASHHLGNRREGRVNGPRWRKPGRCGRSLFSSDVSHFSVK